MITTTESNAILPLNLDSISQLLSPPDGDYIPLSYNVSESTADHVTIEINISQCDSDSIQISTATNALTIRADASVQFMNSPDDVGLTLTREITQTIPLTPGIDLAALRSQINDDVLAIYIPFLR